LQGGVISDTIKDVAKLDDLIEQMRREPRSVRYADACTVADAFFGKPRQQGTSHRVWKMPWAGDPRVNMQEDKGGKAKAYQVQQLLTAIDRWYAERAKKAEEAKKARAETEKPSKKKSRKKS
jgi:hypothetical protein